MLDVRLSTTVQSVVVLKVKPEILSEAVILYRRHHAKKNQLYQETLVSLHRVVQMPFANLMDKSHLANALMVMLVSLQTVDQNASSIQTALATELVSETNVLILVQDPVVPMQNVVLSAMLSVVPVLLDIRAILS